MIEIILYHLYSTNENFEQNLVILTETTLSAKQTGYKKKNE